MEFGIFDYLDRRDEPLARTLDERMALLRAAEAAGFSRYHVTEHHATPLSPTPSPAVFLAAAARETTRIRLGALLFLLPLYNPLRLVEELIMLDNLSNGRLDIGVGRGISPHEFAALGVDFAQADAMFDDALEVVMKGLTRDAIDHHGPFYDYDDVPVPHRPVQRPHPPIWYGLRATEGHERPARHGMNAVTLGPTEKVAKTVANFRAAWAKHAGDPLRARSPVKDPRVGAVRAMFVADTDAEAERIARPAYEKWFESLAWLWVRRGDFPPIAVSNDFDSARQAGTLVVGSSDTVRRELLAQAERTGVNYLVLQLAFGSLGHAREMRSLQLFATEVMPALAPLGAARKEAAE
jgi:alkanesulfonate monooxygenase SsuD/methylene tetrahydromethanopterin reductase-like flavin-dependent oxidoreductase (luciferase family)